MSGGLRAAGSVAAGLAALALGGCVQDGASAPCTAADLDRPAPAGMPPPVRLSEARQLNSERLAPLPAGVRPVVSAAQAWRRLRTSRRPSGGGREELLLGSFTGRGYSNVTAWALLTSGRADPLAPLPSPSGVTVRPDADRCVFVDVLTVLNASDGEIFSGSSTTSSGPLPTSTTARPPAAGRALSVR